jgi:ABC-type sulfate transport system permease component
MIFPIMVRAVRLAIDAIDPGLEQAARTLGAGRLDRLLTVTLPLAAPGVLVGAAVAARAGGRLAFLAAEGGPRIREDPDRRRDCSRVGG